MHISLKEIFGKSWVLTKQHFGFLLMFGFVVMAGQMLVQIFLVGGSKGVMPHLINLLTGSVIYLAWVRASLDIVDGKKPSTDAMTTEFKKYLPFLGAYVIIEIASILGFILLLIPGVYIAVTYSWYAFLIVEKNTGIKESFKQSAALVDGARWKVVQLFLAIFVLNFAGALALLVGLFATIPMSMIAYTLFYRALVARAATSATPTITPA